MATIQKHVVNRGKRTNFRQFFRAKDDEKLACAWRLDFDEIRRVFDVRSFASIERWLTSSPPFPDGTRNKHRNQ